MDEDYSFLRLALASPKVGPFITDKDIGLACKTMAGKPKWTYVLVRELLKRTPSLLGAFEAKVTDPKLFYNRDAWHETTATFLQTHIFDGVRPLTPVQWHLLLRRLYTCKLAKEVLNNNTGLDLRMFRGLWKSDLLDLADHFYDQGYLCLEQTPPNFAGAATNFAMAITSMEQIEAVLSVSLNGLNLTRLFMFAKEAAAAYASQTPPNDEKAACYYRKAFEAQALLKKRYGTTAYLEDDMKKLAEKQQAHAQKSSSSHNGSTSSSNKRFLEREGFGAFEPASAGEMKDDAKPNPSPEANAKKRKAEDTVDDADPDTTKKGHKKPKLDSPRPDPKSVSNLRPNL